MRILAFFLLTISLALACSAAPEQSDYFPVAEGCEWIMDAQLISPDGKVTPATAHRKIEGAVEKDGKKYYRERTWLEIGPTPKEFTKIVRKDDAGFYTLEDNNPAATEQREIVLPIKVGQSWERISRGDKLKDTVVAIETITVGGKTYEHCLHIRTTKDDGSFTEDFWEAPKLGSVKSEMVLGNGAKILLTIREFKPGN